MNSKKDLKKFMVQESKGASKLAKKPLLLKVSKDILINVINNL